MAKVDIETLKFIVQRHEQDISKVNSIMKDIALELKAEEEEKANRPPPVKKQFVVVIADNEGALAGKDLPAWVVQIPEEDSVLTAPERLVRAAREFNTTPKGRRMPVESLGEACEVVSAKLFKEQDIWVKTKVPVLAIPHTNKLQ